MKNYIKRATRIVLSLVFMASLYACGSSDSDSDSAVPKDSACVFDKSIIGDCTLG